jgi:hypothetical protein
MNKSMIEVHKAVMICKKKAEEQNKSNKGSKVDSGKEMKSTLWRMLS